eukprot:gene16213-17845_t
MYHGRSTSGGQSTVGVNCSLVLLLNVTSHQPNQTMGNFSHCYSLSAATDYENRGATDYSRVCLFSIMLLTSVLILIVNLVAVFVLLAVKSSRPQGCIYIGSLLIADLIYAVFTLPYQMHFVRITSKGSSSLLLLQQGSCTASVFFYVLAMFSSLLNTVMVTLDRYIAVTRPFHYKELLSPLRSAFLIALVWALALLAAIIGVATSEGDLFSLATGSQVSTVSSCPVHRILGRRFLRMICVTLIVVIVVLFCSYVVIVNEVRNNLRRARPTVPGTFERSPQARPVGRREAWQRVVESKYDVTNNNRQFSNDAVSLDSPCEGVAKHVMHAPGFKGQAVQKPKCQWIHGGGDINGKVTQDATLNGVVNCKGQPAQNDTDKGHMDVEVPISRMHVPVPNNSQSQERETPEKNHGITSSTVNKIVDGSATLGSHSKAIEKICDSHPTASKEKNGLDAKKRIFEHPCSLQHSTCLNQLFGNDSVVITNDGAHISDALSSCQSSKECASCNLILPKAFHSPVETTVSKCIQVVPMSPSISTSEENNKENHRTSLAQCGPLNNLPELSLGLNDRPDDFEPPSKRFSLRSSSTTEIIVNEPPLPIGSSREGHRDKDSATVKNCSSGHYGGVSDQRKTPSSTAATPVCTAVSTRRVFDLSTTESKDDGLEGNRCCQSITGSDASRCEERGGDASGIIGKDCTATVLGHGNALYDTTVSDCLDMSIRPSSAPCRQQSFTEAPVSQPGKNWRSERSPYRLCVVDLSCSGPTKGRHYLKNLKRKDQKSYIDSKIENNTRHHHETSFEELDVTTLENLRHFHRFGSRSFDGEEAHKHRNMRRRSSEFSFFGKRSMSCMINDRTFGNSCLFNSVNSEDGVGPISFGWDEVEDRATLRRLFHTNGNKRSFSEQYLYIDAMGEEDVIGCSRRNSWANLYFSRVKLNTSSPIHRRFLLPNRNRLGAISNATDDQQFSTCSFFTRFTSLNTPKVDNGLARMSETPLSLTPHFLGAATSAFCADEIDAISSLVLNRDCGVEQLGRRNTPLERQLHNRTPSPATGNPFDIRQTAAFRRQAQGNFAKTAATVTDKGRFMNHDFKMQPRRGAGIADRSKSVNILPGTSREVRITMVVSKKKRVDRKALHAALGVLGLLLICWMPFLVTLLLELSEKHGGLEYALEITNLFASLSAFFSPILYVTRTQGFKMACLRIKSRIPKIR